MAAENAEIEIYAEIEIIQCYAPLGLVTLG